MTDRKKKQPLVVPDDHPVIDAVEKQREAKANAAKWDEIAGVCRDSVLETSQGLAASAGLDFEDTSGVQTDSGVKIVGFSHVTRESYDMDRLMAEHPEIDFERYKKASVSTQVRPQKFSR